MRAGLIGWGRSFERRNCAGVCVCLVFLSRYMRLEGPWQRLAAALADSSLFYTPIHDHDLSPTTVGYTGAILSPASRAA